MNIEENSSQSDIKQEEWSRKRMSMEREDTLYAATLLIAEKAILAHTLRSCQISWAAGFAFAYGQSTVKTVLLAPHDQAVQQGHASTLVGPFRTSMRKEASTQSARITGPGQEEQAQDIADLEEPGLVAAP